MGPGAYFEAAILPSTPDFAVVDPGWWVDGYYTATLQLSRATSPTDTLAIYWLTTLATDPCAQQPEASIGPEPDTSFLAWARSNKALSVTSNTSRRFGNLPTTEMDVSVVVKNACQYTDPISVAVTGYQSGRNDTYVLVTQIIGLQRGLAFTAGVRTRVEVAARDGKLLLIVLADSHCCRVPDIRVAGGDAPEHPEVHAVGASDPRAYTRPVTETPRMDDERWQPGMPVLARQAVAPTAPREGRQAVPQRVPETRPTPLQGVFIYLSVVVLICGTVAITAWEIGTPLGAPLVRLPVLIAAAPPAGGDRRCDGPDRRGRWAPGGPSPAVARRSGPSGSACC